MTDDQKGSEILKSLYMDKKGSSDKRSKDTSKQGAVPVSQQSRTKRGLNILCIDGGGVHGLSSLLLLQGLMNGLQSLEGNRNPIKPADCFDIIAGSGTGGIIACMLGKLEMSIEEAIESYTRLMEAVFSNKKKGGITGGAAYKSTTLKDALRSIIQDVTGDGDKKMTEGAPKPDGCNTLIFATLKDNINAGIPVIFRSYQARANRAPDCAAWEAIYATMAHPDFFKSIDIADGSLKYSFVGGELGNSNPLARVLAEVRDLYPGEYVSCIMSIGAGHPHTIQIPNTGLQQASLAMRAMAIDSERVAEEMARRFQDTSGVYFRFNVDLGVQNIETNDWEKLAAVATHTRAYLCKLEVNRGMHEATKAMHDRNNALAVAWIDGRVQRTLEPAIVKKCPVPTAYYTGRTKEIQGVGSCIVNGGYQQQVCVIYGLGGAGKSQLAFKAIEQNRDRWNHIIYVDATSKETIERALGDFARVNLKYLGNTHRITYTDTLLWLQGTQDPWLLFFDGADDPHLDIRTYFPSYRGSILITTRLEARAGLAKPPEAVYHVSGMDPEDASSLLLRVIDGRAPWESHTAADKKATNALVQDFGFLALAIVHAGAYIAHSAGMSISHYRKLYLKKRQIMLEKYKTLPESSRFDDYDKTVYTTWNRSYELLGKYGKQGAQELLWLIAFLHHDGITMGIFQRAATNIRLYAPAVPAAELEKDAYAYLYRYLTQAAQPEDPEMEENWVENSFLEIIGDLAAYSLIEYDEKNKAYTIHAPVQHWAHTIVPHEPKVSLERTSALLAISIGMKDDPDPDSHDFRVGLGPHVKRLLSDSHELKEKNSHHWEVNPNHAACFANVFRSMKLWHEEEGLRIKIEAARKQLLGLEHPHTLQSTDDLAQNYVNQGQLDRAENLYTEVLEVRRRLYRETHGEEHDDILASKKYLAAIYQHQGQLSKAVSFWEDVVQGYRVSKGGNNPNTLACMDSLASVYLRLVQLDKAEELRKDMLQLMPDDNPEKPTCIRRLAEVLELKEEWDAAERQLVRYQEALKKIWGEGHVNVYTGQQHLYEFKIRRESLTPIGCAACTLPVEIIHLRTSSKIVSTIVRLYQSWNQVLHPRAPLPETSQRSSHTPISRQMTISEVISHLIDHGCNDLSESINDTSFGHNPMACGGFSDIYRGQLMDGTLVAMKVVRNPTNYLTPGEHLTIAARELHTWSKCRHPNVIQLLGLANFRDRIGMVSPWMGKGTLPEYLERVPEANRLDLCIQLCDGVSYLHRNGIIHGDMKGVNVLMSDEGIPVLVDFGNSSMKNRTMRFTQKMGGIVGTIRWTAPELIKATSLCSEASDVYALGMTIYEVVSGKLPYYDENEIFIPWLVTEKKQLPERPIRIPRGHESADKLWELLVECWSFESTSRPSATKVAADVSDENDSPIEPAFVGVLVLKWNRVKQGVVRFTKDCVYMQGLIYASQVTPIFGAAACMHE